MQVNNLKYSLIDKLISIRDISVLEKINELIGNVDVNKPIFKVSESQRQMLMKSEDDIRNGNLTTDDDLNAEEDKWLNA
ncbi:hypothetical protein ACX0G9_05730 [Flavitalea flava]